MLFFPAIGWVMDQPTIIRHHFQWCKAVVPEYAGLFFLSELVGDQKGQGCFAATWS